MWPLRCYKDDELKFEGKDLHIIISTVMKVSRICQHLCFEAISTYAVGLSVRFYAVGLSVPNLDSSIRSRMLL